MGDSSYIFRNYKPADFDGYVWLKIEAGKLEITRPLVSPQALAEDLRRPNYSPQKDLFIVEADGNIVGYMDVVPERDIGRVLLDCVIHPEHRRQGLASRLLGYATNRARELGVKVIQVNILQDNKIAETVLRKLGFELVREFLELRLDLSGFRWQEGGSSALKCRHLQLGEEDMLAQLQNRSFAGTWGYNPNSVEEIIYRTSLSDCSPKDVILACDRDKAVGYCWTRIDCNLKDQIGESKGRISMLGTAPGYRGRGIGKEVLLAGLSYLKSKGVQIAELTVDSSNQVACALYRSVGFRVWASSFWYEKAVD